MKNKPTKNEAQAKWGRLPEAVKDGLKKEFGILAEPMWIFFAMQCGFTEEGEKL